MKLTEVRSYKFVRAYFADHAVLVASIRKYHEMSKIRKGEYTLLDLLKDID